MRKLSAFEFDEFVVEEGFAASMGLAIESFPCLVRMSSGSQ